MIRLNDTPIDVYFIPGLQTRHIVKQCINAHTGPNRLDRLLDRVVIYCVKHMDVISLIQPKPTRDITKTKIKSKSRKHEFVMVRYFFAYMAKHIHDATLVETAAAVNRADHSTIVHGLKIMDQTIKQNARFAQCVTMFILQHVVDD